MISGSAVPRRSYTAPSRAGRDGVRRCARGEALSKEPLGSVESSRVPVARIWTGLRVSFRDCLDQPPKRVADCEVLLVQVGYQLRLVPVEVHSHQHETVHLVPADDDLLAHLLPPCAALAPVCASLSTGASTS